MKTNVRRWLPAILHNRTKSALLGLAALAAIGGTVATGTLHGAGAGASSPAAASIASASDKGALVRAADKASGAPAAAPSKAADTKAAAPAQPKAPAQPAPAPPATAAPGSSDVRLPDGDDSNDNSVDFTVATPPTPRSTNGS